MTQEELSKQQFSEVRTMIREEMADLKSAVASQSRKLDAVGATVIEIRTKTKLYATISGALAAFGVTIAGWLYGG